jgi:hypothetical protein
MLLCSVSNGQYLGPSQALFNSPIQRRLTMISSSQKASYSFERKYLIIPVIVLLSTIISCTIIRKAINSTQVSSVIPADVSKKPLAAQLKPAAPQIKKPKASSTSHPKPNNTIKHTRVEFSGKNSSSPRKNGKNDGNLSPEEIRRIKNGNSIDGASKKGYSKRYSIKPRIRSEISKESAIKRSHKQDGNPGGKSR